MIDSAILGFPRIGAQRELKRALERHWSGSLDGPCLAQAAAGLRRARWLRQKHHGIASVPSNDFSLYDHMLDASCLLGAVPERFAHPGGPVPLETYFRMARGDGAVAALEMTKWFDTNYHYLVPELTAQTRFQADAAKPVAEFREALALGITTRPVLVGPITYLLLSKRSDGGDPLALLPTLLPAYVTVLTALADAGAPWVQIDEPCLATDCAPQAIAAYQTAYAALAAGEPRLRVLLTTYFGSVAEHLPWLRALPVHGLHLDLVRAPEQLDAALRQLPGSWLLSLGVVDGRSPWRTALAPAVALIQRAQQQPERTLQVASSCSLMHVPLDLGTETQLAEEIRSGLAFACQKLDEITLIVQGARAGLDAISASLTADHARRAARAASALACYPVVRARLADSAGVSLARHAPYPERDRVQRERLALPDFPTTTIGSFPQTTAIRALRADLKAGRIDQAAYQRQLEEETARCVRFQEDCGLDVLVHGEFERNDMVEYFGEQLSGYAFTANGWVQSYGSRCVKPPIIVGDVSRPRPMTVDWSRYAQSLTVKPMKGMLTGPVTMLQWSFVRDDLPRETVCRQIALALRDEILDLERAGIAIIQVDEPALREGLPLRRREHAGYLRWAVDCFRLATSGVRDDTQIHTHMCYSEFNDIIAAIAELDADVISIETARSRMELLSAFERFAYPNGIGPGIYDIHSPAVPSAQAMAGLLHQATRRLRPQQLWVNPDCGLKTRGWAQVGPSLQHLVEAARQLRSDTAAHDHEAGGCR